MSVSQNALLIMQKNKIKDSSTTRKKRKQPKGTPVLASGARLGDDLIVVIPHSLSRE